ncbi:LuxR family transcriptional regulator [Gloeocapsopsis crepidinum LEGE 06123]|uniref:LuxR family transcriptional regulator n=1 Tax=Gloeocapsopsis crepidinum LEGE 06123 TaxID=588587 RepID=A0ABR9UX07_9CHRO|nr:LuxR C-terminal-related transcriptional regulator [Gloeocapsopsis crepidinum]MBE9192515.1 LuxR family transcriptional regulator [Gloeocapsopsis crepidinum LEGE 06123]
MDHSLHHLFQAIATAPTEQALRFRFMDGVSGYFGVQRWGIYLLDVENRPASIDVKGVSDTFVEQYQKFGKFVDPVLQYVVRYHAPAHEELVLPKGTWKQSELYKRCCSICDHEHIMTGPIVGQGQLIGTVNFARIGNTPAFNQLDLASFGAVCTHFSARLAELRKQPSVIPNPLFKRLTPREIQIAKLVAKGLTNAEIGAELWITQNSVKQALKRIFRKLEVSTRTEMVAKLRDLLQS